MTILRSRELRWTLPGAWALGIAALLCLLGTATPACHAQAAAEAAAATGSASVAAGTMKPAHAPAGNRSQPKSSSYLTASDAPPVDETNRKTFEEHAGKNPGKLMLHSTPNGAQVFVNGLYVGHAPLLLLLAPAKYEIEMRGARQETGKRTIAVGADETQEIVVTLVPKYPNKISTQ